uniref:hypothetical protein n=1 Tax=Thaumasiovibrio occultus TaxID=1891184 RepID=UPI000B35A0FB|nr:hypothetical protein [Thaumasiovibrio occultus]
MKAIQLIIPCFIAGVVWSFAWPVHDSFVVASVVCLVMFSAGVFWPNRAGKFKLYGWCCLPIWGLASLWWRLWFNNGVAGSFGILPSVISLDGEAAYNLYLLEMFIIINIVVLMGHTLTTKWRSASAKN